MTHKYRDLDTNPEYREYFDKYISKGYKRGQAAYNARRRLLNYYLRQVLEKYPNKTTAQIILDLQQQSREREEQIARRLQRQKLLPTITGIPDLDTDVPGLVAFRSWRLDLDGRLQSTFQKVIWTPVMRADVIPTTGNQSGIYAVRLNALGLVSSLGGYFNQNISGLVELRGEIVEHNDTVLRAEYAQILCILLSSEILDPETSMNLLHLHYPYIPKFVLHPRQIAQLLLRETNKQAMKGEELHVV